MPNTHASGVLRNRLKSPTNSRAGTIAMITPMMTVMIKTGMVMMKRMMEAIAHAIPRPIMTSHINPTLFQFSRTNAQPRLNDSCTPTFFEGANPPDELTQQVQANAQDGNNEDEQEHHADHGDDDLPRMG